MIPAVIYLLIHFYLAKNYSFWFTNSDDYRMNFIGFFVLFNMIRAIGSGLAHNYHFLNEKCSHIFWAIDFLSIVILLGYSCTCYLLILFWCFSWQINLAIIFTWLVFSIICVHGVVVRYSIIDIDGIQNTDSQNIYQLRLIATCCIYIGCQVMWWIKIVLMHFSEYNKNYSKELYASGLVYVCSMGLFLSHAFGGVMHFRGYPEKWMNNSKYNNKLGLHIKDQLKSEDTLNDTTYNDDTDVENEDENQLPNNVIESQSKITVEKDDGNNNNTNGDTDGDKQGHDNPSRKKWTCSYLWSHFCICVCTGCCRVEQIANIWTSHHFWHILINIGNLWSVWHLFIFVRLRSREDTC